MSQTTISEDVTAEEVNLPVKKTDAEAPLQDVMTENAYNNILPARYLHKNEHGEVVETPEELFERVGQNIALAEAVFEAKKQGVEIRVTPDQVKPLHSKPEELVSSVFGPETVRAESVPLTEDNVYNFAYETVVPELPEDIRSHVEDVAQEFERMHTQLDFVANTPTLMNAGDELQQLSACFVDSPADDISDIHETLREASETFQSGGGVGYGFWKLRPYGDSVAATGGIASGPISFMRTFDQMCSTIAQGGARRGAQMGVMRVDHPDIIYFIHAKNKDVSLAETLLLNDPDDYTHTNYGDALEEARELIDDEGRVATHLRNACEGHLSNFNISVGVTDDFMEALEAGEDFTLINPRTDEAHIANSYTQEMYEWFGLGEYVTVGEPLTLPASVLWDRMIDGAYENGEPGVIYLDRINQLHSFDVEENSEYEIIATNPCGEQPLMEYEACNLGHINLSTIVSEKGVRDWRVWAEENREKYDTLTGAVEAFLQQALDMSVLDHRVEYGTRFLDNVVTMSDFPVDKYTETVASNRKIGLGIMGLAQLYVQLGVRYGSGVGNEIARQVMVHINHESKAVSHRLALERGSFANWSDSKYANPTRYAEWFTHHTGENPEEWEDGYPIRNHNTTTVAPTGTTSMLGDTSGGCEPIFNVAYYKNVSDDVQGDEMLVEFDDYFLRVLEANDIDVDAVKKEAATLMSENKFEGVESLETVPTAIGELFVVTKDLSGIEHAAVQCACQEGVDSAISKTCNFPNDAQRDDMEQVYRYIFDNGGKGVTVYRDGTRSKQVLTTRADNKEMGDDVDFEALFIELVETGELDLEALVSEIDGVEAEFGSVTEARPRAEAIAGFTQKIGTGYGNLYVTINEDDTGVFEVFARIGKSGGYTQSFTESLARLVSLSLRSGIEPREIIDQLEGIRSPKVAWDKGNQIHSIPDAIATALRRHLDEDYGASELKALQNGRDSSDSLETVAMSATTEEDGAEVDSSHKQATSMLVSAGENPECAECGSMSLNLSEGCKTCESCGWSECG